MEAVNQRLPRARKTNFKVREANASQEPYCRKNNPKKLMKTYRENHELSESHDSYQLEPKSSIQLKISSKNILPTLKPSKALLNRRLKETPPEMTLDKILGSDFIQIELNQIEDFSSELFPPPRPAKTILNDIHESFHSGESEKENKSKENHEASFQESETQSGCFSEDLHYRRAFPKPHKLYFNLHKTPADSPLESESPQHKLYCQSSTLPSFAKKYNVYSSHESPVLREIQTHIPPKSQFMKMNSKKEDYLNHNNCHETTPAVMILENHEDLYDLEKSPDSSHKKFERNDLQVHAYQIEPHYGNIQNEIGSEKASPAISYKGLKSLRNGKVLKENRVPLNLNKNKISLQDEDEALIQKYETKLGIKPQELGRKYSKNHLPQIQVASSTLSGKTLRGLPAIVDGKKQIQSSTIQSKNYLFY